MEKVRTQNRNILSVFLISFVVLIGSLYSISTKANTLQQPPGTQLAYFVGYHTSNNYVYYHHGPYHAHPRQLYWTGWRYIGHGCRKNCLVDRWSHRVVRCNRVCH